MQFSMKTAVVVSIKYGGNTRKTSQWSKLLIPKDDILFTRQSTIDLIVPFFRHLINASRLKADTVL